MKKAIGQTVRDLKREVNKKVLKVPGIEQKVLDATSNEPWGPHGSLLADIAQATRNHYEYQMIMAVIWKRISDTGKNWRHVYKALTVLEYLVANGSERVIDEIREHAYQISTLANFQYIDSSGRDQGNNVRKKSQSLVVLVNDKERIIETRQKAAANRDKFRNNSAGGMYRPGSYSSSGAYGDRYDDDRYGSRDEDRNGYGYGREREWGYRDDDRHSRDGDRYGRDYEERYSRDGYRDDEYRGRSPSVDDYRYDSRSRSSDRNRDRSYDDDGQRSSRGSSAKAEDRSLEARLERKLSEQNMGAPPSYEEAVGDSRSPVHSERDGETSAASAPGGSSPHVNANPSQISAPRGTSPSVSNNLTEATAPASTATSGKQGVVVPDEFDPRGPLSAAPTTNNVEMDLVGSLSDSFSSNALALVPAKSATATSEGNANTASTASFEAPSSGSNMFNQSFEDPFGDSPFKAIPSSETAPSQPQTYQSLEATQSTPLKTETNSNFGFGDSFSAVPHSASGAGDTQTFSTNSQFLSQDLSSPQQEIDILADILPPAPLPEMSSQQNNSASAVAQPPPSFPASSGQMASQPFSVPTGQLSQQGFSTSQAAQAFSFPTDQFAHQAVSSPNGQLVQPPFSASASEHTQQPFSGHAVQSALHPFSSSTDQSMQPPFASQGGQPAQSSGHVYSGFHSQASGAPNLSPQSPNGYNGPMNTGNFLPQGSAAAIPSHVAPQTPTGQPSQSANYFPHHGGSSAHTTSHMASHSPTDQASQFNSPNFVAQQGNAAPFSSPINHQQPTPNTSQYAVSTGSNSVVSQPPKDKFETKSTVWADTLSRGLVNLNISGPKINPLADIGIDFESINRKEKRTEKPTTTTVTSTMTMGKAMGSGSGMGRAGAGALRPSPNQMMGMGMGNGPGVGMGMGGYGGMNASMGMGTGMGMGGMGMGMGMGQGSQMQPPTGLPPGSNIAGNYNSMMGHGGYAQQPYGGGYR